MDAVPVDGHLHALHVIFHIDDDLVVFAHLNAGTRYHTVRGEDAALHTVRQHALTVAPYRIRGVRCAHLAGAVYYRGGVDRVLYLM